MQIIRKNSNNVFRLCRGTSRKTYSNDNGGLEKRLDVSLQFNGREVLENLGKVSHKVAESFAMSEFEKYRVIQDKQFESDFDRFLLDMKNEDLDE